MHRGRRAVGNAGEKQHGGQGRRADRSGVLCLISRKPALGAARTRENWLLAGLIFAHRGGYYAGLPFMVKLIIGTNGRRLRVSPTANLGQAGPTAHRSADFSRLRDARTYRQPPHVSARPKPTEVGAPVALSRYPARPNSSL